MWMILFSFVSLFRNRALVGEDQYSGTTEDEDEDLVEKPKSSNLRKKKYSSILGSWRKVLFSPLETYRNVSFFSLGALSFISLT